VKEEQKATEHVMPMQNKIKIPKKNTKMKIYKRIRPVIIYSSETWTLTAKDENNLCMLERQILRTIFGPINTDNIWRTRNNVETVKQKVHI